MCSERWERQEKLISESPEDRRRSSDQKGEIIKSKRRKTFGNIAAGTFKLEKVTDSDHAG